MGLKDHTKRVIDESQWTTADGAYCAVVRAAFVRAYLLHLQLEEAIGDDEKAIVWLSSNMRAICESYISLVFIKRKIDKEDVDAYVSNMINIETYESLKSQGAFFERYRPIQPIARLENAELDIKKSKLIQNQYDLLRKNQINKKAIGYEGRVKVRSMAVSLGLEQLYDYLYHATSRQVHFSPGSLLRSGWGEIEPVLIKFDPHNFYLYYMAFNEFYSIQLLAAFWTELSEYLGVDSCVGDEIESVGKEKRFARWPELVTFEELNIKTPWGEGESSTGRFVCELFSSDIPQLFLPSD